MSRASRYHEMGAFFPFAILQTTCARALLVMTLALASQAACWGGGRDSDELDTDFDIPRTEAFATNLSAYGLYQGEMSTLTPASDVHFYEISSELFTDYAKKQRLLKLPEGERATIVSGRLADYPEGTIVAKTFLYPRDFRDASLGDRVIETRVMVKTDGVWNVATYIWNAEQTEATLSLDGATTQVSWVSETGEARATTYEIPDEVACVTCHQLDGEVELIGPTPRNLNRVVVREDEEVDQLVFLRSRGVFDEVQPTITEAIGDYKDTTRSLEERARAYLDINCSHCHNPDAWEKAARQELDLRYSTSLKGSGILAKRDEIEEALLDGEMPLTGTTMLHDEGVRLVLDYLNTL